MEPVRDLYVSVREVRNSEKEKKKKQQAHRRKRKRKKKEKTQKRGREKVSEQPRTHSREVSFACCSAVSQHRSCREHVSVSNEARTSFALADDHIIVLATRDESESTKEHSNAIRCCSNMQGWLYDRALAGAATDLFTWITTKLSACFDTEILEIDLTSILRFSLNFSGAKLYTAEVVSSKMRPCVLALRLILSISSTKRTEVPLPPGFNSPYLVSILVINGFVAIRR